MNHPMFPRILASFAPALLLAFGMLTAVGSAWADNSSNTSISVASDPLQVSVSRPGGPTFSVQYTVTVTNNSSNNNYTYDFLGTTSVTGASAVATFSGSSGVPCTVKSTTQVTCSKLSVNKGTSKSFAVVFTSPPAGSNLRFTVVATSNATKGEGYADTQLVSYEQTTTGFYTFVPKEGGTFYTGANGNGGTGSPGGIATSADPWTTTVVVPPINFTTTARAVEAALPASCSSLYGTGGCFGTTLTIPSAAGAFQSLLIYLRIDRTKLTDGGNIANAVIRYTKDVAPLPETYVDVLDCSVTGGPTSGHPCIQARKAYDTSNLPAPDFEWYGDWEFQIRAVDNGRYIN